MHLELSNEMRNAINTVKRLTEIIKFHNLHNIEPNYRDAINEAEKIINITEDLKIFLRQEVIKELQREMRPLYQRGNGIPSNPFEFSTGHYIASTIPAIRLYRSFTGMPLKEAKEAVDRIREDIHELRIVVMPQGMVK